MFGSILEIILIAILLFIVDLVWLLTIKDKYKNMIMTIQGGRELSLNLYSSAFVYLIMALSIVYLGDGSVEKCAILGMCIYGVYSFTNMALFKEWNLGIAVTETLWGGILFFTVAHLAGKSNLWNSS